MQMRLIFWVVLAVSAMACNRSSTSSKAKVEPAGGKAKAAPEKAGSPSAQTRAPAITTRTGLEVKQITDGLDLPWAIAFLPDERMLVTEKHAGRLRIVSQDGKKSSPVQGVPRVDGRDQGGLLDVALGPDFEKAKRIYLSYYEPREGGNGLAVARARLVDAAEPKLENVEVIFRMQPTMESTKHAGGRLVFAPDAHLFVTLGERSIMKGRVQARELDSHLGKIVRIQPDGSVPKDNPFVDRKDAKPEIWTLGHRNVLGAALDDKNRLWVAEMGPRGGDELNLIERGKDYGWPKIGYGEEYSGEPIHESASAPGLEQPVYYWDPVISPGALGIHSGKLIPEWKGDFLIAGLSSQALIRLELKDDRVVGEERLLTDRGERMREVVEGPDGAVYLLTDSGKLLRLAPR